MATHSSVLAWRIPETGEPGGLPSVGSQRVGHDWSDLAATQRSPCSLLRVSDVYYFEEQYSLYQFKSKYESKMIIDSETYDSRIFWLYNIVVYILFVSVTFDLDFYSHIVPQKLTFVYEMDLFFLLGSPEIELRSLKMLFNKWYFFKWQFLSFVPV